MLFGIVNDFTAYGNLSGYSVKGQYACPKCEDQTDFLRLEHSKKEVYMGHRRFLPKEHGYRKTTSMFECENHGTPHILTGQEVLIRIMRDGISNIDAAMYASDDDVDVASGSDILSQKRKRPLSG
ncbi:hypothetical protein LIER_16266 [Lithospermum erythrorhizon]|uniref:Uncharacterized protein n=1 Tax=Lithospermum erythrorhizon TaxID=34254 RepID=A0AAV3Q7K4_LITER